MVPWFRVGSGRRGKWGPSSARFFENELLALDPPIQRPSGFGIKTPANNLHRGNPNHGLIHWIIGTKEGVSSGRDGVRYPADLHPARLPGWQDSINHQRDMGIAKD